MTCSKCMQKRFQNMDPDTKIRLLNEYKNKVRSIWVTLGLLHNPKCVNCGSPSKFCLNIDTKFPLDPANRVVLCEDCCIIYNMGLEMDYCYAADPNFIQVFKDKVKDMEFNDYTYDELIHNEKAIRRNTSIVFGQYK